MTVSPSIASLNRARKSRRSPFGEISRLDVLRVEAQIERDASPAVVLLDASVVSAVQSGHAVPVFEAEGERLVADGSWNAISGYSFP